MYVMFRVCRRRWWWRCFLPQDLEGFGKSSARSWREQHHHLTNDFNVAAPQLQSDINRPYNGFLPPSGSTHAAYSRTTGVCA